MQVNLTLQNKKAIDAALNNDWENAISLNEEILEKNPLDKDAKIRLGRAYIKTLKFAKAKKLFKDILDTDPINPIAQKNYKLACDNHVDKKSDELNCQSAVLIKEPGITTQINIAIAPKIAENYEPGESLKLKVTKNKVSFYDVRSNKEISEIRTDIVKTIYKAKLENVEVTASVIRPNTDTLTIMLKCKNPIFKSEKQLEKPYIQKGIIDEPEIEIPELEPEEE